MSYFKTPVDAVAHNTSSTMIEFEWYCTFAEKLTYPERDQVFGYSFEMSMTAIRLSDAELVANGTYAVLPSDVTHADDFWPAPPPRMFLLYEPVKQESPCCFGPSPSGSSRYKQPNWEPR